MKSKIFTVAAFFSILSLLFFVFLNRGKEATPPKNGQVIADQNVKEGENADILYWGATCPHCHDTINWIESNNVEEKLTIIRKEVYQNQKNSLELSQKAQSCGLPGNSVGVPFMYTSDGRCLIGTPDITNYLNSRI